MNRFILAISLLLAAAMASSAQAGIRIVRTGTNYATVQAAATAAIDGDTIEIDSGTYVAGNGNAQITRNNLTLRGVGATRPILDAGNTSIQGKGIWLIQGTNTTVEFIEFQNCHVADLNGAGIRQEGATLTVRNCYFHDNENGILGGAGATSDVTLENCEFAYNGFGDGQSHQIYIGDARSLTVRYCYFHHSWKGQEVKSRAKANYILYNRITCEATGYSNYEVSLCQGGDSYVIGNLIHQGPLTQNKVMVDYNSDGAVNPDLHLYVINNTIVNTSTDAGNSIFVRVGLSSRLVTTPAVIKNNIFQGVATHPIAQYFTSTPTYTDATNWTNNWITSSGSAYLAWSFMHDYRLTSSSTGAINLGVALGTSHTGYPLTPTLQYVHPRTSQARPTNGTIDIGAYEYVSNPANQAPYVNAGLDQITTPPRYTVNLDGTVSDDITASPTILWSKVSGPGTVTFGSTSSIDTTATFSAVGAYVLQLQATDGSGLVTTDTVTVTVNPDPALGGTITLQNGVVPDVTYVGCEDNWMLSAYPTTNYGTNDWGNGMGQYAGTKRSLIKFNASAIPSTATVTSAKLRVYMCVVGANRTLEAYQVLRPWTKLASTWNNYDTGLAWTTAGCGGSGTDRAATPNATVSVATGQLGTWMEIPLTPALVQGWVNGTISNYGLFLKVTDEASFEMRFWPENYADRHGAIDKRPQLVVDYVNGLTNLGDFSIDSIKPSGTAYVGGGIAFVPANEDSINQNTLVINWRTLDSGSNYNQIFQRITIPAPGGTPTVLATATIRWDMLYDGTNQFGSTGAGELVYEASTNRLITARSPADGGNRFFWFGLFSTNVTYGAGQVGYSAKNTDNTAVMNKAVISSAGGVYTSFYPYSTNWVKAAMDIDNGNNGAITKTSIAKTAFTGWWPDTSAYPYTVDGFNSEGGTAYGSNVLLIRNYKDSTQGNAQESHLYRIGSALDAAAINAAVDLGNMVTTTGNFANLLAYGMTMNGSTAYVRYGYVNDPGAYNRVLMLQVP